MGVRREVHEEGGKVRVVIIQAGLWVAVDGWLGSGKRDKAARERRARVDGRRNRRWYVEGLWSAA